MRTQDAAVSDRSDGSGMSRTRGWQMRRLGRLVTAVAAFALVLSALVSVPPALAATPSSAVPAEKSVPGHPLAADAGSLARERLSSALAAKEPGSVPVKGRTGKASWPSPGTAALTVGSPATTISGLPITVTAAKGSGSAANVGQLTTTVASHAAAMSVGVQGVLLALSPSGGALTTGGKVRVELSYAGFAGEYGGGWSSRLRLVELPECALTTPGLAACRVQISLATVNNGSAETLTATVGVSPAAPQPVVSDANAEGTGRAQTLTTDAEIVGNTETVLAATSSPSGAQGSYAATPLTLAGSWTAQQGDFSYQYPVTVPPALGGDAPPVTFDYDAQSVDAETSAANTQGGWIGDGWNYSPGSIQSTYQPCSQDGISNSGDLCWGGYNAVLSLDGHSGVLVRDDATGSWHLQGDDGTRVQLETGADNGLWDGEYWVVTTTDGTKYYFGLNHLPGTTSGGTATNSAWGVPVYTPNSGDPCYSATAGASSYCANMGWQWNLDYVVDPDSNLTVYHYAAETNYYEMGGAQNGGSGTLTQYDRGGYPTSVSYGWLLSDAVAGTSPAAQVIFNSSDRCTSTSASTCSANENATYWPDVPWDLSCASSGSCTNYSPTFWITQMLTSVQTEVLGSSGGSSYQNVDGYSLDQCDATWCFPAGAGSNQVIFLNSITRTGEDGSTSTSLPTVSFVPDELDNRVDGLTVTNSSGQTTAAPPVDRPRIAQATTETGEQVDVIYAPPACSRVNGTMPSSAATNTMPCFPVYWTPPGDSQIEDWFNKTLVNQVSVNDGTGASSATGTDGSQPAGDYGSPSQVTNYTYSGGAAWHLNEAPFIPSNQRTYDQYRGYAQVTLSTGAAPDPVTKTVDTYLRGMSTDAACTAAQVTVTSSLDCDWMAGTVLETDTYTGSGGTVDKKVINGPWTYTQTADQAPGAEDVGAPPLRADMPQQSQTETEDLLASGSWGTDTTTTYYDGDARVTAVDADPQGSAETCTATSYAAAPSGNAMMLDYPQRVTAVTGAASGGGGCPAASASNIVSDSETSYDNESASVSSPGSPGGLSSPGGLVTGGEEASTWGSGGENWTPQSASHYDEYGRATWSQDGDGNVTQTSFSPATGALPVSTTAENAKQWNSVTQLDQGRQLPTRVTDPNGNITTETYDALGRLTSVTLPIDQVSGDPTYKYTYSVTGTSPPAVTSQTLREDGSYSTSVSVYDGMGQLRQVQQTPSDNQAGMLVTDTFYDTDGWADKASGPYYVSTSSPGTTMFQPRSDAVVPSQTVTTYDGQGQVTNSATWSDGSELWSTTTAYPGLDQTDVTPPSGGTPTTAITNILGQQTQTWQYTTATADGNSAHADVTAYTYYPSGTKETVEDPDQNTTSYAYNLLGQETSVVSPDSGTSSSTYDNAGNETSATTARGTVSYTYDSLNRKTAEYSGSTSGTEIASWTYDTAAKGEPYSSTSYDGNGQAWTETVSGYNAAYEPTGSVTTIPSDAGSLASPSGGYTTTDTYTPLTGLLASTSYSGDGSLPAETVGQDYDLGGLPVSSGGAAAYVADTTYDAFGQVTRETLGSRPDQVARTYQLDPATNLLETATTNLQTLGSGLFSSTSASDTTNYTYDDAGLVTSESDVQNSGGTQLACFTYNALDQLTQAWTDTQGQDWTNANGSGATPVGPVQSAPNGAVGKCVTSTPSASTVGGPAPYWESYQYNGVGDRTTATMYNTAGNSADNVTQTFGYPTAGTGNGTQPADAPETVITADPAGYVSTSPSYDGAGDASAETNTVTGTAPTQIPPGAQDITYTPDGLIASVVLPGGSKATYQYDGSGALIYQNDPKAGSVLYLDGGAEELTESTGGTVTGYRFYGAPDGSTVVRTTAATATGTGNGGGAVSYNPADQQGTATQEVTVASAGGLAETRRYYDPYGNQESAAAAWDDNKGFVGDPQDTDTGLDLLGARAYDSEIGTFLSPDPEYQPGTLAEGGYAYADDNPATEADPTGQLASYGGSQGGCVGTAQSCAPILKNQGSGDGSGGGSGTGGTGGGGTGSSDANRGCSGILMVFCQPGGTQTNDEPQTGAGNARTWGITSGGCLIATELTATPCVNMAESDGGGGSQQGGGAPAGSGDNLTGLALGFLRALTGAGEEAEDIQAAKQAAAAKDWLEGEKDYQVFDPATLAVQSQTLIGYKTAPCGRRNRQVMRKIQQDGSKSRSSTSSLDM